MIIRLLQGAKSTKLSIDFKLGWNSLSSNRSLRFKLFISPAEHFKFIQLLRRGRGLNFQAISDFSPVRNFLCLCSKFTNFIVKHRALPYSDLFLLSEEGEL